jgi:hypothetical protein
MFSIFLILAMAAGCKGGGGSDDAAVDEVDDVVVDTEDETVADAPVDVPAEVVDDAPTDTEDEEAPGIGPLTVVVVEAEQSVLGAIDNSTVPIEGATVALDAPDGTRSEQTTGTDGRVTFEDLDWSLGTADVTAYKEDLALHSVVDLDGSEEEITVGLPPADVLHDTVTLSGTASNMADTSHKLEVSASNTLVNTIEEGPDWSLPVRSGVAFTLVGLEWIDLTDPTFGYAQEMVAWTMIEHAAVTTDTTVSIDFSSTATPVNVSNSFSLPTFTPSSPFFGGTRAYGWVMTDGCPHGFIELTEPGSDGSSHDIDWEYVEMPGATTTRTVYQLQTLNPYMQGQSYAVVPGAPEAGAHDLAFLDVPILSQSSTSIYPMYETTIAWDLLDTGVEVLLVVWKDRTELEYVDLVWWIEAPADSTSLDVPAPPSTVDSATVLGTDPLGLRVRVLTPADTDGIVRFADSKATRLQP